MTALDEARIRRYLLGRMPEEEAASLEGEYFARGEAIEQVWGVENDLVDAYVAGELGAEERSAFEAHYLASPLHRDRVESRASLAQVRGGPGGCARGIARFGRADPLDGFGRGCAARPGGVVALDRADATERRYGADDAHRHHRT